MSLPDSYPVADPLEDEERANEAAEALVAAAPELVALLLSDQPGGLPAAPLFDPRVRELAATLLAACDGDVDRARALLREYV